MIWGLNAIISTDHYPVQQNFSTMDSGSSSRTIDLFVSRSTVKPKQFTLGVFSSALTSAELARNGVATEK
jgi:hypothetical protein